MDRKRLKFVLLGSGILISMMFLVWVGVQGTDGMVYYKTVGEFMTLADRETTGYRVNGKVVHGSIERMPTGEDVMFVMSDGAAEMTVSYHGIIPDTFVDGADVVVEGRLLDGDTFKAHTLLAKCPSKYDSADDTEAPAASPLDISAAR